MFYGKQNKNNSHLIIRNQQRVMAKNWMCVFCLAQLKLSKGLETANMSTSGCLRHNKGYNIENLKWKQLLKNKHEQNTMR